MVHPDYNHTFRFEQPTIDQKLWFYAINPLMFLHDNRIGSLLAVISFVVIATPVSAAFSGEVPCPQPAYAICPSASDRVNSLYAPPWNLFVDTVVSPSGLTDYVYYWCVKADPPVGPDEEFWIDWQDAPIDYNARTQCGGYAGIRLPVSAPPSDWKPTVIHIGSSRAIVKPNIRKPEYIASIAIPDDAHEYSTELAMALPIKKGGSDFGAVEVAVNSAFSRSKSDPKMVNYFFEYENRRADGDSFASFMFDADSVSHIGALKGVFTPNKNRNRVEFSSFEQPTNQIVTLTFLDGAGETIGSAPVSMALPKQR